MLHNKSDNKPHKNTHAVIYSLEGCTLSDNERSLFKESQPLGFILFARNCKDPTQLRRLTHDLKETLGQDCPILIDQEGGRVQRLKPPVWRSYPPMKYFGDLAKTDENQALEELRFTMLQLAEELTECGINTNCAPVLDILTQATHDAIGDRAFSQDPEIVTRLGLSICRTLLKAGITPIIKHLPGQGHAATDSHKALPRINTPLSTLKGNDFDPFRIISNSDIKHKIWGMVAHVIYTAIDPDHPASTSAKVINNTIRTELGFDGLLLSDDLDMDALCDYGDIAQRAEATIKAGCDIALYCSGKLKDMEKIAATIPKLSEKARKRLHGTQKISNIALS